MPHVTFVHGIGNKPATDALLEQWRIALLDNDGLDLDAAGVSTSLVYWADMLYPEPLAAVALHESTQAELELMASAEDADLSWLGDVPPDEREFVRSLGIRTGLDPLAPEAAERTQVVIGSALEVLPLPWWLKKRLMKVWLRDVHHYLFDVEFSPRPGSSYRLRRDIRRLTVETMQQADPGSGPHVVVAHSLGSVIAYDVLTALDDAPEIDALVTIGSPLGLSEVQRALSPPWDTDRGWPERCLADRRWWNVSDRLDPVCGADPKIGAQYRREGVPMVNDVIVQNPGVWRHGVVGYLGQPAVRRILRDALGHDLF